MNEQHPANKPVLSGGSNDYYKAAVLNPTAPGRSPYIVECNDVIEALDLRFHEANIIKAIWRIAVDRMGHGKPGNTPLYDAEKVVFFAERVKVCAQEALNETQTEDQIQW